MFVNIPLKTSLKMMGSFELEATGIEANDGGL